MSVTAAVSLYKIYSYHALLSPRPVGSSACSVVSRIAFFRLFSFHRYARFTAAKIPISTENTSSVTVADVYRGAGDSEPRSQVDRIPPALVIMERAARPVALRTCGEMLLATQAASAGDEQLMPPTVRNKLPYSTAFDCEPVIDGRN